MNVENKPELHSLALEKCWPGSMKPLSTFFLPVQSCNYLELHFKQYLIKNLSAGQRLNEIGFPETREHLNLLPLYLSNKAYVAQPLLELWCWPGLFSLSSAVQDEHELTSAVSGSISRAENPNNQPGFSWNVTSIRATWTAPESPVPAH